MKLIDADALLRRKVWRWEAGSEAVAVLASDVDAAPTVSCVECEHGWRLTHLDWEKCAKCYCGSNFKRRQP